MRADYFTRACTLLLTGLLLLGSAYTFLGVRRLVVDVPGSFPVDLRLRWWEERLFVAGLNPQTHGHDDPLLSAVHESMRYIGGSYPPWSYTFGVVLAPPLEWPLARWYYALLCLAALGMVSLFAYRQTLPAGGLPASVAAALAFSVFPAAICISYGQYAVPILGLQVAAVAALDSRRPVLAGVLLGLALVKPQLTALLVLALLVGPSVTAAVTAAMTAAAGWLIMSIVVRETPLTVFITSLRESLYLAHNSQNNVLAVLERALGHPVAVALLALLGVGVVAAAARRLRQESSALTLAAIAAIVTMFWSYRKHFDVAILAIPLVVLWIKFAKSHRRSDAVMFLLLGITLWLPLRDQQWEIPVVQLAISMIWLATGAWLIGGLRPSGR